MRARSFGSSGGAPPQTRAPQPLAPSSVVVALAAASASAVPSSSSLAAAAAAAARAGSGGLLVGMRPGGAVVIPTTASPAVTASASSPLQLLDLVPGEALAEAAAKALYDRLRGRSVGAVGAVSGPGAAVGGPSYRWEIVWKLAVHTGLLDFEDSQAYSGTDGARRALTAPPHAPGPIPAPAPPSSLMVAAGQWLRSKLSCGRVFRYSPPSGAGQIPPCLE